MEYYQLPLTCPKYSRGPCYTDINNLHTTDVQKFWLRMSETGGGFIFIIIASLLLLFVFIANKI